MPYEYTRFGDGIVRRLEDSTDDWEPVPSDDLVNAQVALQVAEALAADRGRGRRGISVQIHRSERNEAVAHELGLTADQLADRLAKSDQNQGTGKRVEEGRFDELMQSIDLDPDEARARFKGTHWQE